MNGQQQIDYDALAKKHHGVPAPAGPPKPPKGTSEPRPMSPAPRAASGQPKPQAAPSVTKSQPAPPPQQGQGTGYYGNTYKPIITGNQLDGKIYAVDSKGRPGVFEPGTPLPKEWTRVNVPEQHVTPNDISVADAENRFGYAPQDASVPPLDESKHIPDNANIQLGPGLKATPSVITIANQLLDGQDIKEVKGTQKAMPLAEKLAGKYGWERNKFAPRELTALLQIYTWMKELRNSPALDTMDEDFFNRWKMAQSSVVPEKEGNIGKALTLGTAMGRTPEESEFIRIYNQLIGTVSGLGGILRPGRATEASIERLKTELPNPWTTTDSQDAEARLTRLLREIPLALRKGNLNEMLMYEMKPTPPTAQPSTAPSTPKKKWSKKKWLESFPGGDVGAAAAEAARQGREVVE